MTRLIVWRHGQTAWNHSKRVQGQADIDLDETGRAQTEQAAGVLARLRPELIVSSDLRRARATAGALAAVTGLPVQVDQRLRERHFGTWQGRTQEELIAAYPDDFARWRAGEDLPEYGMEPLDDLGKRVAEALQDAADTAAGGTVVVATHGLAARHGCRFLLGWPPELVRTMIGLANCHWTELRHDGASWRLYAYNVGHSA